MLSKGWFGYLAVNYGLDIVVKYKKYCDG